MDWLAENWVWVLIGIAFVGMHFIGHGRHGGHGGHGSKDSKGGGCCGGHKAGHTTKAPAGGEHQGHVN